MVLMHVRITLIIFCLREISLCYYKVYTFIMNVFFHAIDIYCSVNIKFLTLRSLEDGLYSFCCKVFFTDLYNYLIYQTFAPTASRVNPRG